MAAGLDKPKVLLVGPTPPPMGGIVRYCQDIMGSEDLARDFELEFFNVGIPFEMRPRAYSFMRRSTSLPFRDGVVSGLRQMRLALRIAKDLRRRCRQQHYDIIHVPSCTGLGFWRNALHVTYAKKEGCKVLWQLLGAIDDFWDRSSKLLRHFVRKYLDRADVHVVQSTGLREITANFTCKPVVAIFNGVRTDDLIAPDGYAHSDPAEGKIRVLTIGGLGRRKGIFDTMAAAKRLIGELPQLQFVFVGSGDVDYFRRLIADEGLSDHFVLAGQVDEDEKQGWLHASDIYSLPSYQEGQPIAILEAMAAGLPVISTKIGSIPEVIKEANGRLMVPGDVDALMSHIRELATSAALRETIGRHNAAEAAEKYSLTRTMRELGDVYRMLLG